MRLLAAVCAVLAPILFLFAVYPPEEAKPKVRVAATVNGEGISVHRFQLRRARANARAPQGADPKALMDGLIDRVLFAQKAATLQLDRKGFVPIAIQEAKTEILAQAYIENLVGSPLDGPSEVRQFYVEHPRMFEARRIFRVFELAVIIAANRVPALKKRVARADGLQEIADWLKSQGLAFSVGGVTKPSEHLAPKLLAELSGMKEGEVRVLELPGRVSVLQLVHSEPAPLSLEAATPLIEKLLRARKRQEIVERERKYLRTVASIEYAVDLEGAAGQKNH